MPWPTPRHEQEFLQKQKDSRQAELAGFVRQRDAVVAHVKQVVQAIAQIKAQIAARSRPTGAWPPKSPNSNSAPGESIRQHGPWPRREDEEEARRMAD